MFYLNNKLSRMQPLYACFPSCGCDNNFVAPLTVTFPTQGGTVSLGPIQITGTGTPGFQVCLRTNCCNLQTTIGPSGNWSISTNLTTAGITTIVAAQTFCNKNVGCPVSVTFNAIGM